MKNLIYLLFAVLVFSSCEKESSGRPSVDKSYLGTYLSTSYDTAFVSENESYLSIKISRKGVPSGYHFQSDSLVLDAEKLTFQCNEIVSWKGMGKYRSIGNGSFVGNKLSLSFTFQSSILVTFDGYKQ